MPIESSNGMPSRLVTACNCGCVLIPAPRPDSSSGLRSNTVASQPMLRSMFAANRPPTEPPMMSALDLGMTDSLAGDAVEFSNNVRGKRRCPGADILFGLLGRGRAGDHACGDRLRRQPAEGEIEHAVAAARRKRPQLLDDLPVARVHDRGVVAAAGKPRALGR